LAALGAISSDEVENASAGNYQDIVTLAVDHDQDDNAVLIKDGDEPDNAANTFSLNALGKVRSDNYSVLKFSHFLGNSFANWYVLYVQAHNVSSNGLTKLILQKPLNPFHNSTLQKCSFWMFARGGHRPTKCCVCVLML
jgi:hypothetical protein